MTAWSRSCVDTCHPEYVRNGTGGMICANPSPQGQPCPSPDEFKYSNGSCLSSCPYPCKVYNTELEGYYYCYAPCDYYYNPWTELCEDTCFPEFVRVEDDIAYCEMENNSTDGCPNHIPYKYPDGSCSSSCKHPSQKNWRDGSYYCDAPCPIGLYLNLWEGTCVDSCRVGYIRILERVTVRDERPFSSKDCADYNDYLYLNGSCLPSCQSPFNADWRNGSIICMPDCPNSCFNPLTERCVDKCPKKYRRHEEGFEYCDQPPQSTNSTNNNETYSATVEIYLRYDIPLKDFNAGGYLAKFIT